MAPVRPCPYCGKDTDFHKDEIEGVEDGSVVCLDCGMEVARNAFILEVIAGEHPELVEEILSREEDDDEDENG